MKPLCPSVDLRYIELWRIVSRPPSVYSEQFLSRGKRRKATASPPQHEYVFAPEVEPCEGICP